MTTTELTVQGPYDLGLSLQARASFSPEPEPDTTVLQAAVRIEGKPALLEVRQAARDSTILEVSSRDDGDEKRLREQAGWIVLAALDLLPFYRSARNDPVIGPLIRRFRGMKPIRPATLFEMAVDAVIEQQISLAAARRIRARVVERFGERKAGLWIFPASEDLAGAPLTALRQCGLSNRKAEYINGLAGRVVDGSFDLEGLKGMSDDEVRSVISGVRGFGRWSADYILIRGLGRPDAVPVDDLAVRTIVGRYLGDGSRMTAAQVEERLKSFAPFRGLAVFYLLVHHRLATGGLLPQKLEEMGK
jgi:DNA-3-methyladenine glycosylase II